MNDIKMGIFTRRNKTGDLADRDDISTSPGPSGLLSKLTSGLNLESFITGTNGGRSRSNSRASLLRKSSKVSLVSGDEVQQQQHTVRKTQSKLNNLVATATNEESVDESSQGIRQLNFGVNKDDYSSSNTSYMSSTKPVMKRKVSINELSHIRSNSLSHSTSAVTSSYPKLSDSIQESEESEKTPVLLNKKSFSFFNKLVKNVKARPRDLTGDRYMSNQNMEIVQTQIEFSDSDEQLDEIQPREPDTLHVNVDGRLSTMTEDSFYFKARTPTTPVYINDHSSSNVNLREKPLPEIQETLKAPLTPEETQQLPVADVTPRLAKLRNSNHRISKIIGKLSFSGTPKARTSVVSLKKESDFIFMDDELTPPKDLESVDSAAADEDKGMRFFKSPRRLTQRLSGLYKHTSADQEPVSRELSNELSINDAEIFEAGMASSAKLLGLSPVKVNFSKPVLPYFTQDQAKTAPDTLQFLNLDQLDQENPQLSPIEEVDSPPETAEAKSLLLSKQRAMPSITSSLHKFTEVESTSTETSLPSPSPGVLESESPKSSASELSPMLSLKASRSLKSLSKLSETLALNSSYASIDTTGSDASSRNKKTKSPRGITSSIQEDFLTRSAKTLSTISTSRKTLRPISAAFRTPMLPDFEDDVESTPIFPNDGKNNSQITLNFDETNVSPHTKTIAQELEEAEVLEQSAEDIQNILEKEGFNEFKSPVNINYEKFVPSRETSPVSEFEFATAVDYSKGNRKLDFGLTLTPIEMSRDPIFANISKNKEAEPVSYLHAHPTISEENERLGSEPNPFLDTEEFRPLSLPKKQSLASLNQVLNSSYNLETQVPHSNSSKTLTKITPTTSPYKSDFPVARKASLVKRSNSFKVVTTTPRSKLNTGPLVTPDTAGSRADSAECALKSPGSGHSVRAGSPKHKPSFSSSTNESIYQEVYGNLKLREDFKSDLSLNNMKKSPSLSSLDLKGRHRSRHYSSNLHTLSIELTFVENEETEELASLFVKALHSFDSSSLNSEDTAICLTFEKNDIAFVYNVDESGWGEVVLLSNLSKGWVPMNYFRAAIDESVEGDSPKEASDSRSYLKPLFIAAAEFLLNPQEVPKEGTGEFTFSSKHMNNIRDGVKLLLQYTDSLSRTAPVVHKRPVVRKVRKALLADWYTLMSKAEKYKGTTKPVKIDFLKGLTYKVLIKAIAFLDIWGNESEIYEIEREQEKQEKRNRRRSRRKSKPEKVAYLDKVPFASERLQEVKVLLLKYLSLIMGRLDIIEHNYNGCEQLESIIHQVILLLRELLFIGKSATILLSSSNVSLDSSLDNLLALVSDLVTSVKSLVSKTEAEDLDSVYEMSIKDEDYLFTKEGSKLIRVVAQMVTSVSDAANNCQHLLTLTKDFQLNIYRKYPDFDQMKISPEEFIRKCVVDFTENQSVNIHINRSSGASAHNSDSFRYSHIRGGSKSKFFVTGDGLKLLREYTNNDGGSDTIVPITNEEYDSEYSTDTLSKSVVYDDHKNVIGASFKSLVYLLANERNHPTLFFIATFFMSFRQYGNTKDMLKQLIKRFDIGDREKEFLTRNHALHINEVTSYDSRLKKRRKMILTIVRVWLESYWSYENDFQHLPILINFVNEGAVYYLQPESFGLLELAAKIIVHHPSKKRIEDFNLEYLQLISRRIGLQRKESLESNSIASSSSENDLSSLSSSSSVSSLVSLPLNFSNYHLSSIMSKSQVASIEKTVLTYRGSLGELWPESADAQGKQFPTIDSSRLIEAWFRCCAKQVEAELPETSTEIYNLSAVETAKQLTALESKIFLAIQPEELLEENFREKRIQLQKSPNVERSILFTNLLGEYVLDLIIGPGITLKNRIGTLKQWLKIAVSCYQMRNYNSFAAIVTTLQSLAISRLDRLWSGLSNKYIESFDSMIKVVNPDKNYKVYRNMMKPYLTSDENKCSLPLVPYINLFLQDIIFANDGNPNYRTVTVDNEPRKLINFDKQSKIVKTISEMEFFQVKYLDSNGASTSGLTSPVSKSSVFSFSPSANNTESLDIINPNLPLQELLLFNLWSSNQNGIKLKDRFWKYSTDIQPLGI